MLGAALVVVLLLQLKIFNLEYFQTAPRARFGRSRILSVSSEFSAVRRASFKVK